MDISGGYKLTTKDQISYTFDKSTQGRKYYCTKIQDRNGNAITLSYTGGFPLDWTLSSISDPTNRTITLGYTSGRISSVTSPQNRSWSISYNGNGEISQITWPTVSVYATCEATRRMIRHFRRRALRARRDISRLAECSPTS